MAIFYVAMLVHQRVDFSIDRPALLGHEKGTETPTERGLTFERAG